MKSRNRFVLRARACGLLLLSLILASCSDSGTGGTEPGPTPAITLALSVSSATIPQGGASQVGATLTRSGGFTGNVNLTVQGTPNGVGATVSNVQASGGITTAVVTIQVGANVAPGTYNLTVRGSGSGVSDATAAFALTVTAAAGFTLAATPNAVSMPPGGASAVGITITRTGGFSAAVSFTVTGAPNGLTAQVSPSSTTGNSVQLNVTASAALAAGTYTLTVNGTGPSVAAQTAVVQVTITQPAPGGNATVNLSCYQILWFAYQDGNGPWTRVTGNNNVFTFPISSNRGGFVWVYQQGTITQTIVQFLTRAELTAAPYNLCPAQPALKSVTVNVAGLGAGDQANFWLGTGGGFAAVNGGFLISGIQSGTHDLVAWRHSSTLDMSGIGNPDRGIIRRDLNPAAGSALAAIDFGSGEAFAPASATITVGGVGAGEFVNHTMGYYTTQACTFASLYGFLGTHANAASFTASGVPAAQQRNTDFHQMSVTGLTRPSAIALPTAVRGVQQMYRTHVNRTINLPAPLPAPTITTLAGPYKRLQASFTIPAEYQIVASFGYIESTLLRLVNVSASLGWIGSTSAVLAVPDFSAANGWNNAWAPGSASTGTWTAAANGNTLGAGGLCVEGARIVQADQRGSY